MGHTFTCGKFFRAFLETVVTLYKHEITIFWHLSLSLAPCLSIYLPISLLLTDAHPLDGVEYEGHGLDGVGVHCTYIVLVLNSTFYIIYKSTYLVRGTLMLKT